MSRVQKSKKLSQRNTGGRVRPSRRSSRLASRQSSIGKSSLRKRIGGGKSSKRQASQTPSRASKVVKKRIARPSKSKNRSVSRKGRSTLLKQKSRCLAVKKNAKNISNILPQRSIGVSTRSQSRKMIAEFKTQAKKNSIKKTLKTKKSTISQKGKSKSKNHKNLPKGNKIRRCRSKTTLREEKSQDVVSVSSQFTISMKAKSRLGVSTRRQKNKGPQQEDDDSSSEFTSSRRSKSNNKRVLTNRSMTLRRERSRSQDLSRKQRAAKRAQKRTKSTTTNKRRSQSQKSKSVKKITKTKNLKSKTKKQIVKKVKVINKNKNKNSKKSSMKNRTPKKSKTNNLQSKIDIISTKAISKRASLIKPSILAPSNMGNLEEEILPMTSYSSKKANLINLTGQKQTSKKQMDELLTQQDTAATNKTTLPMMNLVEGIDEDDVSEDCEDFKKAIEQIESIQKSNRIKNKLNRQSPRRMPVTTSNLEISTAPKKPTKSRSRSRSRVNQSTVKRSKSRVRNTPSICNLEQRPARDSVDTAMLQEIAIPRARSKAERDQSEMRRLSRAPKQNLELASTPIKNITRPVLNLAKGKPSQQVIYSPLKTLSKNERMQIVMDSIRNSSVKKVKTKSTVSSQPKKHRILSPAIGGIALNKYPLPRIYSKYTKLVKDLDSVIDILNSQSKATFLGTVEAFYLNNFRTVLNTNDLLTLIALNKTSFSLSWEENQQLSGDLKLYIEKVKNSNSSDVSCSMLTIQINSNQRLARIKRTRELLIWKIQQDHNSFLQENDISFDYSKQKQWHPDFSDKFLTSLPQASFPMKQNTSYNTLGNFLRKETIQSIENQNVKDLLSIIARKTPSRSMSKIRPIRIPQHSPSPIKFNLTNGTNQQNVPKKSNISVSERLISMVTNTITLQIKQKELKSNENSLANTQTSFRMMCRSKEMRLIAQSLKSHFIQRQVTTLFLEAVLDHFEHKNTNLMMSKGK